jgi:hypothetical protein
MKQLESYAVESSTGGASGTFGYACRQVWHCMPKKEKNWLLLPVDKFVTFLKEICQFEEASAARMAFDSKYIVDTPEIACSTILEKFQLRLPWTKSAVILCLPVGQCQSRQELEYWCRSFFEILQVPAMSFVPQPLMATYGCGVVNGLVIDVGYETLRKLKFGYLWNF